MPEKFIQDKAKQIAAVAAADLVQDGMILGLGTGTTITFFLERLIERIQEGLKIEAIATSKETAKMALNGGISLLDEQKIQSLDLVIDGADEIDPQKQMIKGGGGALLREKITAYMAQDSLIIVDEKKCVKSLGAFPLPVEIAPFGYQATLKHLIDSGFKPIIRKRQNEIFITDNGNYIADLHFDCPIINPKKIDQQLHGIPGVLETGLFLNIAKTVIVGHFNGTITTLR